MARRRSAKNTRPSGDHQDEAKTEDDKVVENVTRRTNGRARQGHDRDNTNMKQQHDTRSKKMKKKKRKSIASTKIVAEEIKPDESPEKPNEAGTSANKKHELAEHDQEKDAKPPKKRHRASSKNDSKNGAKSASNTSTGATRDMEKQLWAQGYPHVIGVDEAGRGPLAGPVVAAACCIPPHVSIPGINDSKQLTEEDREALYEVIVSTPGVTWAAHVVDHTTIDRINILQATFKAMTAAATALPRTDDRYTLVDGNKVPKEMPGPSRAVVQGDAKCFCIAAASIIAKVTRDRLMLQYHEQYPQYGFNQHKGYAVPAHYTAIAAHGPCDIHRRSFQPIRGITGWTREAQLAQEAAEAAAEDTTQQPAVPSVHVVHKTDNKGDGSSAAAAVGQMVDAVPCVENAKKKANKGKKSSTKGRSKAGKRHRKDAAGGKDADDEDISAEKGESDAVAKQAGLEAKHDEQAIVVEAGVTAHVTLSDSINSMKPASGKRKIDRPDVVQDSNRRRSSRNKAPQA